MALLVDESRGLLQQAMPDADPAGVEQDMQIGNQVPKLATRMHHADEAHRDAVPFRQHQMRRRPANQREPGSPAVAGIGVEGTIKEFVVENSAVGSAPACGMDRRNAVGVISSGEPDLERLGAFRVGGRCQECLRASGVSVK